MLDRERIAMEAIQSGTHAIYDKRISVVMPIFALQIIIGFLEAEGHSGMAQTLREWLPSETNNPKENGRG